MDLLLGVLALLNCYRVIDDWTSILEDGGNIDAIYMDFMKAFGSVPHYRLLQKIESSGIQEQVLGWMKAFLVGRQQRVVVNGCHSNWSSVLSGIPQGSIPRTFAVSNLHK